eukprot:GHVU01157471.1.p3 GENE.GHVU01157471.1~~GHVU01157471.1.p3  ORF type:complete len:101 (+),score=1.30 GHVU01157471.1:123-425(+)
MIERTVADRGRWFIEPLLLLLLPLVLVRVCNGAVSVRLCVYTIRTVVIYICRLTRVAITHSLTHSVTQSSLLLPHRPRPTRARLIDMIRTRTRVDWCNCG